jgi:hypothetical protein
MNSSVVSKRGLGLLVGLALVLLAGFVVTQVARANSGAGQLTEGKPEQQ